MSEGLGLERSRAFEVSRRSFTLPDLTELEPVTKVTDPVETDIAATYYDTADLRLAARHTTLQRSESRTGARWVLRLQDDDGAATEVGAEADATDHGAVPEQLAELVRGSVRDKRLEPVAAIRTVRVERRLLDLDGRELARVTDDAVHGQRFTAGSVELSHWREVTVELLDGDLALLDATTSSLEATGVVLVSDSTLHRALGWSARPVVDLRGDDRDASVAGVLRDRLRHEVALLVDQDWAVRTERPDARHDMRTAAARLRCALATWRPFLDEARTEPVRRELRWLAALLGRLSDAEALEARLIGTIRGLPTDMVVGPVIPRIDHELQGRRAVAAERLRTALDGGRYFALLDSLETLTAAPPFTSRADGPGDELLAERVAHAMGRLDRTLGALDDPSSPEVRADRLHDVRKAARRAGYAADAVEVRFGRRARRLAGQLADLQEALGAHRDSVVARRALRDIGAAAHVAGESAFTYGILHGIERDRGDDAEQAFETARQRLAPVKVHRWASP